MSVSIEECMHVFVHFVFDLAVFTLVTYKIVDDSIGQPSLFLQKYPFQLLAKLWRNQN